MDHAHMLRPGFVQSRADLQDAARVEQITQLGIDRATAVRQVLGPGRDLLLDAHSKFDLARGLLARQRQRLLDQGGTTPEKASDQALFHVCHMLLNTNEFLYAP